MTSSPSSSAAFEGPADIRVEVNEDEKGYEVRAEVPGAKKDDIRVAIDGNQVSISTEIKAEKETGSKRVLVRELYYGSCARSFRCRTRWMPRARQPSWTTAC
jgi:HSP20 family protein